MCYSRILRIFNFPRKNPYLPCERERERERERKREIKKDYRILNTNQPPSPLRFTRKWTANRFRKQTNDTVCVNPFKALTLSKNFV